MKIRTLTKFWTENSILDSYSENVKFPLHDVINLPWDQK